MANCGGEQNQIPYTQISCTLIYTRTPVHPVHRTPPWQIAMEKRIRYHTPCIPIVWSTKLHPVYQYSTPYTTVANCGRKENQIPYAQTSHTLPTPNVHHPWQIAAGNRIRYHTPRLAVHPVTPSTPIHPVHRTPPWQIAVEKRIRYHTHGLTVHPWLTIHPNQ